MSTTDTLQTLKHSDDGISSFLQKLSSLKVDNSYYLILLAGKNQGAKRDFINKLKKQAENDLAEIDLRDVVTTVVEESRENIGQMISSLGSGKYVLMANGDQLGGVYTGFSYSVCRYSTPQERYLLKRISEAGKIFILDLNDIHTVNNSLKRHAHTLITFDYPDSFLGKLKQITVHGHTFSSKRRERA